MPKLTNTVVDAAKPGKSQFTIWCSKLKGFGVFIHPTGTRTYFVDYRNAQKVRRRMTISQHGVVTTEEGAPVSLSSLLSANWHVAEIQQTNASTIAASL